MTDTAEREHYFACPFYTNVPYAGIDFDYVEVGRRQLTIKFFRRIILRFPRRSYLQPVEQQGFQF